MIDYNEFLNPNLVDVKPSGIRKFFSIAEEMDNVISLGVGEPDFLTPWHIRQQGIDYLERGATRYTANAGLIELRNEISRYYTRKYLVQYDPKTEVLVTVGGSEGIDMTIRTLIGNGDEVLVVEPSFVCYKPIIEVSGGKAIPIATKLENEFKLTPEDIENNVTPKTKAIVLPFPNNPTGAIMTREDLEPIAEIVKEKDLYVISDEIYAELTYGSQRHVSFASIPEMYERTVIVSGFSKAYAMTGWRLGYACGHPDLIKAMTKVHQFAIMSAPTTAQYAAIEALKNGDNDIAEMRAEYDMRRHVMVQGFNDMGLDCFEPEGAFYTFPCIKITGLNSNDFCEKLLYDKRVAVVPGTAFGASGEGFIRCSYAYSIKNINDALERIEAFVKGR